MTKPNPEGKFISCQHNHLRDTVVVGGVRFVLCLDCYAELESQVVTEFLRKVLRQGVESSTLYKLFNKP